MIKKYGEMSDKELLELYHEGDQWAFDEIIERYKDAVKYHARFFYLTGGDREDLLQEGMIGLFEAANTYREDRNASFSTFADMCIRSRIIKAVKFDNKKNNQPLNNSLSIENEKEKAGKDGKKADSVIVESDEGAGNPETIIVSREMQRLALERIKNILSDYENIVVSLYLQGKTLRDISYETDSSYKSVENAFSRIKTKVKKIGLDLWG